MPTRHHVVQEEDQDLSVASWTYGSAWLAIARPSYDLYRSAVAIKGKI
jgi:hypothetical protein